MLTSDSIKCLQINTETWLPYRFLNAACVGVWKRNMERSRVGGGRVVGVQPARKEYMYSFSPLRREEETDREKKKGTCSNTHSISKQSCGRKWEAGGWWVGLPMMEPLRTLQLPPFLLLSLGHLLHLSLHLFYPASLSVYLSKRVSSLNDSDLCFLVGELLCIDRATELINGMHCCTAGVVAETCPAQYPAYTCSMRLYIHTTLNVASNRVKSNL